MRKIFNFRAFGVVCAALSTIAFGDAATAGPIGMVGRQAIETPSLTEHVYYRHYCGRRHVRHWGHRHYGYYPAYGYPGYGQYYGGRYYYPNYGYGYGAGGALSAAADVASFPFGVLFGGW
jgi:hypothetical protein